jgi:4-alpha-glucanotransferase
MRRLPQLITATNMLTCAEDLGMIPACVPPVLGQLKILTLEIQRMPKEVGVLLGNPAYYPYLSLCTTGTHDTSTLRGWWIERYGADCPSHHCEDMVDSHLHSPAMLTILPLQDWLSLDDTLRAEDPESERINVPSNPKHYWRYRMHITLEELFAKLQFNSHIAHKVILSGRSER